MGPLPVSQEDMNEMRIEIIEHHAITTDNIDHYLIPGQVFEVDDEFGRSLVSQNVAKQIGAPTTKMATPTKNKMVEPDKNKGAKK